MKNSNKHTNIGLAIGMIIAAVIFRIIPHPFNITPLIGIALFSGAKIENKKLSILIPVITFLLSDVLLSYINNYSFYHSTILFTYGSILLIVLLGRYLQNQSFNIVKTTGFTLLSSLLFFVISNFGVWLFGNMYSMNLEGLINCYVMAIPFNRFTWLGDLVFTFVLFEVYEIVNSKLLTMKAQQNIKR